MYHFLERISLWTNIALRSRPSHEPNACSRQYDLYCRDRRTACPGGPVAKQTADILTKIDDLLAAAGTRREQAPDGHDLARRHFFIRGMNRVWDNWVVPGSTPCRPCVEARLAGAEYTVEIQITAAL
ncbi:Rid family hydrolase [Mesorhizobium sp.]|uniref:Rid family hydrolase n=1 Tax=Mesorhizobium sp. TaxID=1871066 RepID=UPI00343DA1DC